MVWQVPAIMAANMIAGGVQGGQAQRSAFADRQQRRDLAYEAVDLFNFGRIGQMFNELQTTQAPLLNQLLAGQDLAGQQTASALRAGLARQGLGGTGLGTAMGAGARAGAAFGGNMLRARMLQDLLQQAIGVRGMQAQVLSGVAANPGMPTTQTALTGALGGLGSGIQAAGLWQLAQGGGQAQPIPS